MYTVQNENGYAIIRNHRHLILTDEKFTQKFSNDNIRPASTKLPEGVAPLQTTNLSKHVTSLTTINHLRPITPNLTKETPSWHASKKPNWYIEQCWSMFNSVLVAFEKKNYVTLLEYLKGKNKIETFNLDVDWKKESCSVIVLHHIMIQSLNVNSSFGTLSPSKITFHITSFRL